MYSESPKSLDSNPSSVFAGRYRNLFATILALNIVSCNSGCGDENHKKNTEITSYKGWGCVSVLDQKDQPMTNCAFDYELLPEDKSLNNCANGQLFMYGSPSRHQVSAECGKLAGYVDVKLVEGANETYQTHLIGSFCSDGQEFVADPNHQIIVLNDHLGSSTATRCDNWLSHGQLEQIEVVATTLDCNKKTDGGTGDAGSTCDPIAGRDYLIPQGKPGEYSGGEPKNLTFVASTDKVPAGSEAKVNVTLRKMDKVPNQELEVPIVVRGATIQPQSK